MCENSILSISISPKYWYYKNKKKLETVFKTIKIYLL